MFEPRTAHKEKPWCQGFSFAALATLGGVVSILVSIAGASSAGRQDERHGASHDSAYFTNLRRLGSRR